MPKKIGQGGRNRQLRTHRDPDRHGLTPLGDRTQAWDDYISLEGVPSVLDYEPLTSEYMNLMLMWLGLLCTVLGLSHRVLRAKFDLFKCAERR